MKVRVRVRVRVRVSVRVRVRVSVRIWVSAISHLPYHERRKVPEVVRLGLRYGLAGRRARG